MLIKDQDRSPLADIAEGIDRLMTLLSSRAQRYMDHVTVQPDTDYPLIVARDARQLGEYVAFALELGLYEPTKSRITLEGWRRIEALRRQRPGPGSTGAV